ncbi:hypothetical protein HN974_01775, partial [bacterium]|nr:hypothetical protein [bacterium]
KNIQIVITLDKSTQSHVATKIRNLVETVDARWVKPEIYSIQLAIIKKVDEESLFEIGEILKEELCEIKSFDLSFEKIAWGPNSQNPKMLWLVGPQSGELIELRNVIEQSLNENAKEISKFSPHIKLAKIPKRSFSKEIDLSKIKISVDISVDNIDIIEVFQDGRTRSTGILQSIPLSF